jgi:glycyl-tRNA synthetase (class II)
VGCDERYDFEINKKKKDKGVRLEEEKRIDEKKVVDVKENKIKKGEIGKVLKKDEKDIIENVEKMDEIGLEEMEKYMEDNRVYLILIQP